MRHAVQSVEAEQGQCRTAPDHERALPAERAGKLESASPGYEEGGVVLAFHEYHPRMLVELIKNGRWPRAGVRGILGRASGWPADRGC